MVYCSSTGLDIMINGNLLHWHLNIRILHVQITREKFPATCSYGGFDPYVDKAVDANWSKKFDVSKGRYHTC